MKKKKPEIKHRPTSGMRGLLRGRAHALMAKAGMFKVNREHYVVNPMRSPVPIKQPSYFAEHWREWAAKPWPAAKA